MGVEVTAGKLYPHVTGIFGDGGENEGALAVSAQLDPSPHYPCARIIVGSPSQTPTIAGYIPDLGGFSCGIDGAERLVATLQLAMHDVRVATGQAPNAGAGAPIPALWFDARGCGPSDLALQLKPFAAEMDGRIPASLGIQVRAGSAQGIGSIIYGAAFELVDSGFNLHREQVEELHRQTGAWLTATPQDAARPRVVCLCGSTRFYAAFQRANYEETMAGRIVLSVGVVPNGEHGGPAARGDHGENVGCTPAQKLALDELHKRKIDMADEVLVLNVGGYVGESTRSEIEHAERTGKPIRWLEPAAPGPVAA